MARFCTTCGSALGDEVRFCAQCGTAVAPPPGAPAPIAPATVQAAGPRPVPPPAKSGGSGLKIAFVLLACFLLVMLLGVGSCFYVAYRAHRAARELSQTYHFDMRQGAGSSRAVPASDVCTLVTKEEVGEALGTTVSEARGGTSRCQYTFSAANPTSTLFEVWPCIFYNLRFFSSLSFFCSHILIGFTTSCGIRRVV
jgi:hypothetical protein